MKHKAETALFGLSCLRRALSFVFATFVFASVAHGDLVLVKDGKAVSRIVLAAKPTRSAQVAAKELQHHLKLITGAELSITTDEEDLEGGVCAIHVGETVAAARAKLTNESFKGQEYLVRVTDDYVLMMGHDNPDFDTITYEQNGAWPKINLRAPDFEIGTLYAVYEFLETLCGVRWYMPTELGTVCPQSRTLTLKPIEIRKRPWTTMRLVGNGTWAKPGSFGKPDLMGYTRNRNYSTPRDNVLYMLRMRYNGSSFNPSGHGLHGYSKVYGKAHPEWFVGDSPGRSVQLRYWKGEVVDEVAKNVIAYFGKPQSERVSHTRDPRSQGGHGDVFALGPLDNRIFGPDCKPPRQPERTGGFSDGQYSNYWFTFVNRVARKVRKVHPDKWIASPAYASHFEPPEFDLEPNVGICMANTEGWTEGSYGLRNLTAWSKKAKRLFAYEYWYSKARFPQVRPQAIAAYVERLRELGVEGVHMEMISNSNAALYHLDYYVTMRMLFDEEAKAQPILDEYFPLFYGPAEAPMREFWTLTEDFRETVASLGIRNKFWYVMSMTNIVDRLEALLTKAEELAGEDPYVARVKVIRTGVLDMMKDRITFAKLVESTPVPVVEIKKTALKPVIDGDLGDEVWQQAAAAPPFARQKGGHGWRTPVTDRVMVPCPDTEAKIAWDGENLYFGFRFLEDKMDRQVLNQKHSSSGICTDDSIEFAIDVGRRQDRKDYVHVMLNALGTFWLQWTRYGWCKPVPVDLGITGKAQRGPDRWTAEFVVPLNVLTDGKPPQPGDDWGLNMLRNRFTGTNRAFWSQAFSRGGFHVLDRFGVLHFVE